MAHGGPEQSRAGLDVELQPLREALQEVQELRRAALLWLGLFERALFWLRKARKAQEKLANDFKTAKEAQARRLFEALSGASGLWGPGSGSAMARRSERGPEALRHRLSSTCGTP